MSREQEIEARAARARTALVVTRRYLGKESQLAPTSTAELRQLVGEDIPYLRAELREAQEMLDAVKEFRRRHSLGLGAKLQRELDSILKGGD